MIQHPDLATMTLEQLDELAEEARAGVDVMASIDPVTAIGLARLLWELYQEIRRRGR